MRWTLLPRSSTKQAWVSRKLLKRQAKTGCKCLLLYVDWKVVRTHGQMWWLWISRWEPWSKSLDIRHSIVWGQLVCMASHSQTLAHLLNMSTVWKMERRKLKITKLWSIAWRLMSSMIDFSVQMRSLLGGNAAKTTQTRWYWQLSWCNSIWLL